MRWFLEVILHDVQCWSADRSLNAVIDRSNTVDNGKKSPILHGGLQHHLCVLKIHKICTINPEIYWISCSMDLQIMGSHQFGEKWNGDKMSPQSAARHNSLLVMRHFHLYRALWVKPVLTAPPSLPHHRLPRNKLGCKMHVHD